MATRSPPSSTGRRSARRSLTPTAPSWPKTWATGSAPHKFAYCNFVFVGETDEEAMAAAPNFWTSCGKADGGTGPGRCARLPRCPSPGRASAQTGRACGRGSGARPGPGRSPRSGREWYRLWVAPTPFFAQMREFFYAVGGYGTARHVPSVDDVVFTDPAEAWSSTPGMCSRVFRVEVHEPCFVTTV